MKAICLRNRLRLIVAVPILLFVLSSTATPVLADAIYTLKVDYSTSLCCSGVPGSILNVEFSVPSILTTTTTGITSLSKVSIGGALTGCVPSSVEVDNPSSSSGDILVNYTTTCGPGNVANGSAANFQVPFTAPGTYDVINNPALGVIGTLTISTPEPSAVLLLGTGLLGLAGISLCLRSLGDRS